MSNRSSLDRLKQKTEQFLLQDETRLMSMSVTEIRTLVSELNQGLLELEKLNHDLLKSSGQKKQVESADINTARFTLNSFGCFVNVDQACAEIFGVSRKLLQGSRIFKYIRRDSKKVFFRHCLETLETGIYQNCHLNLVDKNGDEIQISLESRAAFDKKGNKIIDCRFVR
jgi:PAS domain-containing protein